MVSGVMGPLVATGQGTEGSRDIGELVPIDRVSLGPWGRGGWESRRLGTERPWRQGNDSTRDQGSSDNVWWPRGLGPPASSGRAAGKGVLVRSVAVTNAKGGVGKSTSAI